jgi:hypothetical protein
MRTRMVGLVVCVAAGCDGSSPQPKGPNPGEPIVLPKAGEREAAPAQPATPATGPHGAATAPATQAGEADATKIAMGGAWAPKPATWTWTQPTLPFRSSQYIVPARDGSGAAAEFIVSLFAPGDGGTRESNIARWTGQFRTAEGEAVQPVVSTRTVEGIEVTLIELKGSYQGMSGPSKQGQMQLGAIFETEGGMTFLRLLGPEKTVEAHRAEWDAVIAGLKKGT